MTLQQQIILQAIAQKIKDRAGLHALKQSVYSAGKKNQPSNQLLLKEYRKLLQKKKIAANPILEKILKTREIRTLSGVAVITVLTKPYPCPGACIYCPSVPTMPKSYLPDEPAAARALSLKFNPHAQVKQRIEMLKINGHDTDKIELIVKGGTWSAYPRKYQDWFIKRCFEAANNIKTQGHKNIKTRTLEEAQKVNETTKHRIIGLTLELRPDSVTPEEIKHLRQLGCTRIEMGVQTIDDKILKLIQRGHTAGQVAEATQMLRDAGFKVDYHLMPALPGVSLKKDLKNFKKIFTDSRFRPDMIKIYPCSVIPGTKLYKLWKNKNYTPPTMEQLLNLIIKMKLVVPRYVRISRIIRDIPGPNIAAGNKVTSLRQNIQAEMMKQGLHCKCIRCREIGHQRQLRITNYELLITNYRTLGGREYFLSIENPKRDALFAFCRLRLPNVESSTLNILPELKNAALIRELHTYGHLVPIESRLKGASRPRRISDDLYKAQHLGSGKQLIKEAEKISKKAGYKKMAVISGIGAREYYKKLGYRLNGNYMVKTLQRRTT